MTYDSLLDVPDPWPKVNPRKWNAKLIPMQLAALARAGKVSGDKVL